MTAKVDFLQHHELMKDELVMGIMVTNNGKSIYCKFRQYGEIDELAAGMRLFADEIETLK